MHTRSACCGAAVVIIATFFSACDVDLFGFGHRWITREYYMRQTDDPDVYVLGSRSDNGGPAISEIGWQKPFIIARSDGDKPWQVIDTRTKQRSWLSGRES